MFVNLHGCVPRGKGFRCRNTSSFTRSRHYIITSNHSIILCIKIANGFSKGWVMGIHHILSIIWSSFMDKYKVCAYCVTIVLICLNVFLIFVTMIWMVCAWLLQHWLQLP